MGKLHLATVICGSFSLLLLLVALSSDHWVYADELFHGLWNFCVFNQFNQFTCSIRRTVKEYIVATRVFLILAVTAGFISCGLLYFLFSCSEIGSCSVAKSAAIASFLAGLLALVAMAIYTGGEQNKLYFSWSYFVGWFGVLFFLVTGGLANKLNRGTAS